MKRVKNLWTAICGALLALIMVVGGLQLAVSMPKTSAADEPDGTENYGTYTLTGVTLPDTVNYMAGITIPTTAYTVNVTKPNGEVAEDVSGTVENDQLGIYTVSFVNKDGTDGNAMQYDFRVLSKLENELTLRVENDARIPSVVKTHTEGAKGYILPGMQAAFDKLSAEEKKAQPYADVKVGYYDEDDEWVDYPAADVVLSIYNDKGDKNIKTKEAAHTFNTSGSEFITYQAVIGGGTKILTQVYSVKVQQNFKDTAAPTIEPGTVTTNAVVNQKYTLPVATVSDAFDERPEVIITVEVMGADGWEPVKKYDTDKHGFAIVPDTAEAEAALPDMTFDNSKNMYFYPTKVGQNNYRIVYKAVDDNGNPTEGWTYSISCADKGAAPKYEFKAGEDKDGLTWAHAKIVTLVDNDADDTDEINAVKVDDKFPTDFDITFVLPEMYDNYCKNVVDDKIGVRFTLKNPDGDTIVTFSDINGEADAEKTETMTGNGKTENQKYTFSRTDGFKFNTARYVEMCVATGVTNYEGTYVATYVFSDPAGNTTTKEMKFTVKNTLEDTDVVTTEFKEVDNYFLVDGDKTFTMPDPNASTTHNLVYGIREKDDITNDLGFTKFTGGETVKIEKAADGKVSVSYKDGEDKYELIIADNTAIELYAYAVSPTGNTNEAAMAVAPITLKATKADSTDELFGVVKSTGVDNVEKNGIEALIAEIDGKLADSDNKPGEYKLSTVCSVAIPKAMRNFVAVELGVKNAKGAYLSSLSAEFYDSGDMRYLRDISFSVSQKGWYFFEMRVYDVNGNSVAAIHPFYIESTGGSTVPSESYALPSSGDVAARVKFANRVFNTDTTMLTWTAGNEHVYNQADAGGYVLATAHKMSGGRFAFTGNEFIGLSDNRQYNLTDRVVVLNHANRATDLYDKLDDNGKDYLDNTLLADAKKENTVIRVKDNTAISFELQDVLLPYVAVLGKDTFADAATDAGSIVKLPKAAAYTNTARANSDDIKIEVSYTGPSASSSDSVTVYDKVDGAETFKVFKVMSDGTYTVTYNVTVGNKSDSFTFTVRAGDVLAPDFIITKNNSEVKHADSAKVDSKFEYYAMTLTSDDSASDITFTKTLTGPDKEVISTSKITGTGTTTANKTTPTNTEIKLESTGTYTVRYEAKDKAGNVFFHEEQITVYSTNTNRGVSFAVLSTILIIIGVLLIIGVVVYLIRYRSFKPSTASRSTSASAKTETKTVQKKEEVESADGPEDADSSDAE